METPAAADGTLPTMVTHLPREAPDADVALRNALGIYLDDVFFVDDSQRGTVISTDCAFALFAAEVGLQFHRTVIFGRARTDGTGAHTLAPGARLVGLPYYRDLRQLRRVVGTSIAAARAFWRGLDDVGTVWVFGPNPFSIVFVALALLRRRRVVLGIRQDGLEYFRARIGNGRVRPALAVAWTLDRLWRLFARRLDATVVGSELARAYGPRALAFTVSLVSKDDVVRTPPARDWSREITLLTVGRIDVEKDPFLTLELMARLEAAHPGRFHLVWLGRGPLEEVVRRRVDELGLSSRVDLRGYVPFGPELLALYRSAHVLVHVSLTEGIPQTVVEALACGTPVVASSVGGIPDILDRGAAGLLVPPRRVEALAEAVLRLTDDGGLRLRLVERGLAIADARTLEGESARAASFLARGERGNRHR